MRNRNWIWFFVVLILLGSAAIGINYWYSLQLQLKPEDLKAAEAKWKSQGPVDYDLKIAKEISSASGGDPMREEINVNVRAGQVIKVTLNGRELAHRLLAKYDVSAWFDYLDEFMEIDTKPNAARVFCEGQFDRTDGHPTYYRRRVARTRERQELSFDLRRVNEGRTKGQ
ncbi:MAG: DUF6174 domain-containing protein [Gemmataceae bacterium]